MNLRRFDLPPVSSSAGPNGEGRPDDWRPALADLPPADLPPLDLPADFTRPPVFSRRGASLSATIEAGTAAGLALLAGKSGAGLAEALLAGLAALLHRITGSERIAIGLPAGSAAGVPAERAGEPVVVVPRVDGERGFADLVAAAAKAAREAFLPAGEPFAGLAAEAGRGHDPSRHPLFQVGFRLGRPERPEETPLDLDFHFAEADGGDGAVDCTLVYAADLFTPAKAGRLLDALAALLAAGAADPARPVARLPLMPPADEALIRAGHGSEPLEYPRERLLHETFFLQAAATPERIALRAGEQTFTYAATAELAGRVAWALRGEGALPESRVGVFLERDHRLVATLIGVLAADAAYVPLDPEYPAERIGFTLEDAEAALIVTQRSLAGRLPATRAKVLLIEELAARPDLPAGRPQRRASQRNLAYLIYTSGSTGRPKGVAIEHRSAVAFLEWTRQVFSERELSCVLFSTSICFDISIFEIFATLQRGGTVVVVKNAFELPQLACRDQLTLIDTVPSVTRELLRDGHLPPGVETVNLAGEALPQDLVDRCWQEPGVKKVYNFYGPSEDTTFSTYEMCLPGRPPTIGRLIAGSRGFVVDAGLELLPPGFPGELHLAGEGLSRGYLGRPRLTAERYLPDPFSGVPGARMYRTGDLIRHREDGGFDFNGRLDHQVKVRGYRVELGEIEIALREHPAVAQAVAMARGDGPGGQRLVSYVVLRPGSETGAEELRAFLARRLPPFMVPASTVFLGAFPLTPNGKIDRKILPPPELSRDEGQPFRPPRSAAELAVAAIWAELLRQERIGLDDDFFVLGGDSILVIQAVSRTYAAGWDLEPWELFLHTTLEGAAGAARPIGAGGGDGDGADEGKELDRDELADVLADLEGVSF